MRRYKNILFVASDAKADKQAMTRAVTLAQENQACLTVLAVVKAISKAHGIFASKILPDRVEELHELVIDEHRKLIKQLVAEEDTDELELSIQVLSGTPFIEIIRQVKMQGYDLVIKAASSETGALAQLFGSTDLHLLRKCPCPVWIIKPGQRKQYSRILAAVDVDRGESQQAMLNRLVLELVSSLARLEGSELHIVHAWELFAEAELRSRGVFPAAEVDEMVLKTGLHHQRWLNESLAKCDLSGLAIKQHVIKGDPRNVIPDVANKQRIELIVMGTVARTGLPGLFIGNTAEAVLTQVDCSVLAVKPEGFISPVEVE